MLGFKAPNVEVYALRLRIFDKVLIASLLSSLDHLETMLHKPGSYSVLWDTGKLELSFDDVLSGAW